MECEWTTVMNDILYGVPLWGTNRFLRENLQRFPMIIARTRTPQPACPAKAIRRRTNVRVDIGENSNPRHKTRRVRRRRAATLSTHRATRRARRAAPSIPFSDGDMPQGRVTAPQRPLAACSSGSAIDDRTSDSERISNTQLIVNDLPVLQVL
jgi:D-serine deaminase-like pyridoxal phosphate-dependent protein